MKEKRVIDSRVKISVVMLPQHANPAGLVHGGVIMKEIDNAAGVVAMRHTRTFCVTASIDRLDFYHPVYIGNLVTFQASLNFVGTKSMEIGVRVETEDIISGKKTHTASAYLTYVALNENFKPMKIQPVIPDNDIELRRQKEAEKRKKSRFTEKRGEKQCQENFNACK